MGDATLGRIAGLAEGWSLEAAETQPAGEVDDVVVEEATPDPESDHRNRRARALSDTLFALEADTSAPTVERAPPVKPARPAPPPIPREALSKPRPHPPPPLPPQNHTASGEIAVRAGTATLAPAVKPRDEDTSFDPRSPVAEPTPTPAIERIVEKKSGVVGDVAYVGRVFFSALSGRRELASMRERLAFERAARERRLAELAKAAAADPRLDDPALEEARHRLRMVDEDVARHEKDITDADAEAKRAEGALKEKLAAFDKENAELEARIAKLEKERLAPLEAEAAERKKRFDELKASLADSSRRIATIEKRLARATVSEPEQRADVEADLAAARAEKQGFVRDEPNVAAAVTDLAPKVDAARKERDDLRAQIKKNKEEAASETERLEFQAKAARGRKAESERGRKAVAGRREQELVALGETIDRERPRALLMRLRPADEHAAAVAILERRILELEDAAKIIDRPTLIRGVIWLALTLAAIGALVWVVLTQAR